MTEEHFHCSYNNIHSSVHINKVHREMQRTIIFNFDVGHENPVYAEVISDFQTRDALRDNARETLYFPICLSF